MNTYQISFLDKKSNVVLKTIKIESEDSFGVIFKAKVKATISGFIYSEKKHYSTFEQL